MVPLHILINPHARGGRARRLMGPVQQWLHGHPGTSGLAMPESVPEAHTWLRSLPPGSRVALVGGDGTVNQMLPALLECGHCLAVVPMGSGNDVARALGVARLPWQQCLELARQATARPMDVGWLHANGEQRPFLSSLTVGFDSAVGYRALQGPRWLRGLPRYLLATLREIAALQTWQMTIHADGALAHQGTTLFASSLNTPTYGSGMPAAPDAQIDDGRLNALIAGRFGRLQALGMLPLLLAGRHLGHPRIRTLTYEQLQVTCETAMPLATDGEWAGKTRHVHVQIAPAQLQVVRASPTTGT